VDELVDLLLGELLAFDYGGLAFDCLADGVREALLGFFVVLDGGVGLAGYVGAKNAVGSVPLLLLLTELVIYLEHILLQIINEHVPLFNDAIDLGHDLPVNR